MKTLFWIGLVVLILGIVSLVVPIPRNERDGVKVAGVSIGIETRHDEKVSPIVSAVMILGGAGLMIAGKGKSG
jgi:hypothetical protein